VSKSGDKPWTMGLDAMVDSTREERASGSDSDAYRCVMIGYSLFSDLVAHAVNYRL
jgi:hypothetical protein